MAANLAKDRILLISTHIVSDIEALSTRNAIMRKGKLAGYGTTDELTKPLLGKVWEIRLAQKEADDFLQGHHVLSTRTAENGETAIRFVCEEAVGGVSPVHPQLEDIFLWKYLGEKGLPMLKLELKRILRLRSTAVVAVVALLCACAAPFLSTIGVNGYRIDESGNLQTLSGYSGVRLRRETETVYDGPVTPELLWQVTNTWQALCAEYGSNNIPNEIFIESVFPADALLKLLNAQYSGPGMFGYEGLLGLSQQDMEDFYSLRGRSAENYLAVQLGESSAAYQAARRKADEVQTPFVFYAHPGWPNACGNISMLVIIAMLAGCVISAQVFSAEYQSGAYMILRAAKNGREKLARVKVLSCLIVSGGLYLAMLLGYSSLCVFIFGAKGLNAPIQFASFLSPMPFAFKDVYLLSACMGLVTVLAMSAFAVFLSSRFAASVFPVVISFSLPAVQQLLGGIPAGWANLLGDLLPSSGAALYGELFRINYLEIGSIAIWSPWLILFANMIAIPVCGILTVRSYCGYKAKYKGA